jgi:hypothetical protein
MAERGSKGATTRALARLAVAVVVVASVASTIDAGPRAANLPRLGGGGGEPTRTAAFGMLPSFAAHGDGLLRLQTGAFDPLSGEQPRLDGIPWVDDGALPTGAETYWIVQVRDQRFAEVVAAIEDSGAHRVGNVPDDSYMVRATPLQRLTLAAHPAVRWAGLYQPAWRVPTAANGRPGLLDLKGRQTYRVHLFRDHPDPAAAVRAITGVMGVRMVGDGGTVIDVQATAAQVPAVAAVDGVQWVTVRPTEVPLNANARWVIDTGERDLLVATALGRLTGAGQTAAVADSGVNYTRDKNGRAHVAFRDCNPAGTACEEADYTQADPGTDTAQLLDVVQNNPAGSHRKMSAFFDLGDVGPNPPDDSAHGTHTGGSVAGDAGVPGVADGHDGLAPGARLVYQSIADADGGLNTPTDYYQLFRQAYRPRNPAAVPVGYDPADYANYEPLQDARTHNNSYGATFPIADPFSQSIAIDQFVWDHEDMSIVASNGNAGPGLATISAPAVSKNGFSSAASSNGRQPMVSIDSLANFSSHGPTGDGRLGTTVATPGEIVIGPKGGTVDEYHYLQGTSMSGPVLVGALTLVRQYFWDGYGPAAGQGFPVGAPSAERRHNPSAAMVKAAVINGATRMRGYYTGDDGTIRDLDGQWPSTGQGFGLMNLDNSLYFAADSTNAWYRDVYRAHADAFPIGVGASRTYQLQVAPGAPLDVSLAWTDAPDLLAAGTPNAVNNLDLVVEGPGGEIYVGNNMNTRLLEPGAEVGATPDDALALPDLLNNVERVHVPEPAPGVYTVTVDAPAVADGPQGFALAASGLVSAPATAFTAGPARQADIAGPPTISDIAVEPVSADLARVTFRTSEPTTAKVTVSGVDHEFPDVYTLDADGYHGIGTSPVETSPAYSGRAVVGTRHEVLVTGLGPGGQYQVSAHATDLSGNSVASPGGAFTSPASTFQPRATDIAQLSSENAGDQWAIGKQLYAGNAGVPTGGTAPEMMLGAFMFRLPESVDPATITGAHVELTSAHDLSSRYTADPVFDVELLDPSVEAGWGSQSYQEIAAAPAGARLNPAATLGRGGRERVAFAFSCSELAALKATLETKTGPDRAAAFRFESTDPGETSLQSMEFGFNRRSGGAHLRPKLVLQTSAVPSVPPFTPCDPSTPAPLITDVGLHPGLADGHMTVSWRTDQDASSVVIFREQGTAEWRQVASAALTKLHQVEVRGLLPDKRYEFGVRSVTCNGATTTADNGGAGWDFFRSFGPAIATTGFDFDDGDQGWTTTSVDVGGTLPSTGTAWERRAPGHDSAQGWYAMPYGDHYDASLVSPVFTTSATATGVDFYAAYDLEQPLLADTTDGIYVDWSTDGTTWTNAALLQGSNPSYPDFDLQQVTFPTPPGPVRVRIRLSSDDNLSSPVFEGAAVDEVTVSSFAAGAGGPANPTSGPIPPTSAGKTGLQLASVAPLSSPTPAELAAGTGVCVLAARADRPLAAPAAQALPPTGGTAAPALAGALVVVLLGVGRRRLTARS